MALFQGNLGWWNIIIWPDQWFPHVLETIEEMSQFFWGEGEHLGDLHWIPLEYLKQMAHQVLGMTCNRKWECYAALGKWMVQSLLRSFVPHGKSNLYKWLGGIPNGIRGTDLCNLFLNFAYVEVVRLIAKCLLKYTLEARQGDDMWLKTTNIIHSIALYASILAVGISCQPSKQLFAGGTRGWKHEALGEFLRVLYSEQGMFGYSYRVAMSIGCRWLPLRLATWARSELHRDAPYGFQA